MRSVISHCCLFSFLCALLFIISRYVGNNDVWPGLSSTSSPPLKTGLSPMERPVMRPACLNIKTLLLSTRHDKHQQRFQQIPSTQIHLFSAYLDRRHTKPQVVLIGAAANFSDTFHLITAAKGPPLCLLVDGPRFWRVDAVVEEESGYFGMKKRHSAIVIRCEINRIPSASAMVGITFNYCDRPVFFIPIIHNPPFPMFRDGLEICISPLPNYFNSGIRLMEFVEHHRLAGVRHFTFYVESLGPAANSVMEHYVAENIVSLVPWDSYPFVSRKTGNLSPDEMPNGHVVAIQDCLYRRMNYKYPYLLFLNLEEAIFPASSPYNHSLIHLTRDLFNSGIRRTALRIRHGKITKKCEHQLKSKWIIRADAVLRMKSHWIGSYLRGVGFNVPSQKAMVLPLTHWRLGGLSVSRIQNLKGRLSQMKEIHFGKNNLTVIKRNNN